MVEVVIDSGKSVRMTYDLNYWLLNTFWLQNCYSFTPSPQDYAHIYEKEYYYLLVHTCEASGQAVGRLLPSSCCATLAEAHNAHIQMLWDITIHRMCGSNSNWFVPNHGEVWFAQLYVLYKMYACCCMSKCYWLMINMPSRFIALLSLSSWYQFLCLLLLTPTILPFLRFSCYPKDSVDDVFIKV
jgi:hypothetical protein